MTWLAPLGVVAILIGLNALYVAAEFGSISTRRTRLVQLASEGNALARSLLTIVQDPARLDAYIATCQLGITATSLALGYYGQGRITAAVAPLLADAGVVSPLAAPSVAATVVLLGLTALQVVLAELVPKNLSLRHPERLALATVLPMRWSAALLRPFVVAFNGTGRLVTRRLGFKAVPEGSHVHRPEEIIMLVEESSAGGLLAEQERRLLRNTLRWREMTVRQALVPRTRMLTASVEDTPAALLRALADSPHSRLPVYEGTIDNIVGIVHLKDLLCLPGPGPHAVRAVMRPVPFVPESAGLDEVFVKLQEERHHLAVVLDEFGGTAGMVAVEDLVEAIFGELQDEFDTDLPPVQVLAGNRVLLSGDVLVDEVNEWFNLFLPGQEVDTLGGLVLSQVGRVPEVGEIVAVGDVTFCIEGLRGRSVAAVSLAVTADQVRLWRERNG